MDSLINRFRKIKNNRKNFALLQSCFKIAFFKKSPKDRLSKKQKTKDSYYIDAHTYASACTRVCAHVSIYSVSRQCLSR